jgi:hypothetical protein
MQTHHSIIDVLEALERSKIYAPKDQDYLAQDPHVMMQVMELQFQLKSLGDHLGISLDQFPPIESLENDEVKLLVEKMLETFAAYNYFADLPKGVSIRAAYKALLELWHEEIPRMPEGEFHFDFYDTDFEQLA